MNDEKRFTSNDLFIFAEFCMIEFASIPAKTPNGIKTISGESLHKIKRILNERKEAHIKAIKERDEKLQKVEELQKELNDIAKREADIQNALINLAKLKERQLALKSQIEKMKLEMLRTAY